MPGRLPTAADFPSTIKLTITPPPPSQSPTNILLLLHGLGDTSTPFTRLGSQLSLPETTCVAIQAASPLPFDLGGFHWGDDLIFDQKTGDMDWDTGFKGSVRLVLDTIIREVLMAKCGYKSREIMVFGFGQGGTVGLQVAAEMGQGEEMGGIISIGGPVSSSVPLKALEKKIRTPVLACRATSGSEITEGGIKRLRDVFEFVEVKEWKKSRDGMPSNREEMLPIMQFFARRLRSTRGVPPGSMELT